MVLTNIAIILFYFSVDKIDNVFDLIRNHFGFSAILFFVGFCTIDIL
ncbi:hypothetical protein GPSY_0213 [Paraglaciecola psychrophila 170]|nr:hypothetical protein GPSY_0213 [Paraglaciecola psychrophila 170]